MKLNNRGWGLSFLIIIGVLFLTILIFVSIRIRSLTKKESKSSSDANGVDVRPTPSSNLYIVLEEKLKDAGDSYVIYHPTLVENTVDHTIITYDELKNEGLIDSLPDPDGEGECSGYNLIKDDGEVKAFIQCTDYETINYSLWVD